MKILKLIILWSATIALTISIFYYGQVPYYWYANDQNRGYSLKKWHGQSLDNSAGYPKGFYYKYRNYKFENNPETRTAVIILILMASSFLSLKFARRKINKEIEKQGNNSD